MVKQCEQCHAQYKRNGRRHRFCSKRCWYDFNTGSGNCTWQGGFVRPPGYFYVMHGGKRMAAHRLIMEKHLGRPLLPTEFVHHINWDITDNRLENLQVVSNPEHGALHTKCFRSDTEKECSRCRQIKPRTEFHAGQRNGIKKDPHHTECKACRKAYYAARWAAGLTAAQRKGR